MSERFEGGCLCGAVRYRIEGAAGDQHDLPVSELPQGVRGGHRAVAARRGGRVTIVAGTPVEFRSSPDVQRTFCGRCGTPLTAPAGGWQGGPRPRGG